jgi:hypothetical protein
MQNLLLIAITLMLSLTSFSQTEFSEYKGNTLDVVVKEGSSQGKVFLELGDDIGLTLKSGERAKFVAFVKEMYKKSCGWDSIAKANNITDMDQKTFGNLKLSGFFNYGSWKFGTTTLELIFSLEKGKSAAYLYGSKMTASNNQFMESESMIEILDADFVSYISEKLSDKSINDFVASKNKVDSLFD